MVEERDHPVRLKKLEHDLKLLQQQNNGHKPILVPVVNERAFEGAEEEARQKQDHEDAVLLGESLDKIVGYNIEALKLKNPNIIDTILDIGKSPEFTDFLNAISVLGKTIK